jgi:hypothetical protein
MSKRKPKAPASPMCRISWIDASMAVDPHWSDGTQPPKPKARDHVCISVGWLTHFDDHFAQVTQTLTTGQHANVANIPRGMIRDIEVLGVIGAMEL